MNILSRLILRIAIVETLLFPQIRENCYIGLPHPSSDTIKINTDAATNLNDLIGAIAVIARDSDGVMEMFLLVLLRKSLASCERSFQPH